MSESAESEPAPGYQRFDCTGSEFETLTAAADAARQAVEQGECIVLPTDTVYGIGADAFNAAAVQRLLEAKHRGRDMPPPVLMGEASLIRALATDVPDAAKKLIEKHWPGPLTVICQIQPSLRMDLGDTDGTIALRVPDHALAREVLRRTGPMAVSSANLSGRPAALTCDDAIEQLGDRVGVYLDVGVLDGSGGAPSTIVDFTQHDGGEVLRHGAVSLAVLRETLPDIRDLAAPDPAESGPPDPDRVESDPVEVELVDPDPQTGTRAPVGSHVLTKDADSADSVLFEAGEPWQGGDQAQIESDQPTQSEPNPSEPDQSQPGEPGRPDAEPR